MSNERTHEIEVEEHIAAPPEEVFEHLADPALFPPAGSPLTRGEETDREAPRRIAWRSDGGEVEVLLRPDGTGTRVRVRHVLDGGVATPAVRMLALAA